MNTDTASTLKQFLSLVPVQSFEERYSKDITENSYFSFPLDPLVSAEKNLLSKGVRSVGYFSMEFGLSTNSYNVFQSVAPTDERNICPEHNVFSNMRAMDYYLSLSTQMRLDLPIYSGGLGVLAGDTLKSAADRGVSMAAVGILWNKGYFKQNFWFKDGQIPEENDWDPKTFPGLVPLNIFVDVVLKKETVKLKLWKYFVYGFDKKSVVPLILLDSDIQGNSDFARQLTGQLYRSDNAEWKLLQRIILGVGGMKALNALGYSLDIYHLNEGHAALAFTEKAKSVSADKIEELKSHFAYTCHTPVAAGHDIFPKKLVQDVLLEEDYALVKKFGQDPHSHDLINLTQHAMGCSLHVNAVAQKHGEVTRVQFPEYKEKIQSITNGVHTHTWMSESIAGLLDAYPKPFEGWRKNQNLLGEAKTLGDHMKFRQELWNAHQVNKSRLCKSLKGWRLDENVFTIAWARRIASYKRPSLLLQDAQKLLNLAKSIGPIQIIFAGKAHPKDDLGFTFVNEMLAVIDGLEKNRDLVRVLMLENYDTYLGKLLSSGVDVWLNNPLPPFEASGTSGMKAILNGVLQLSTLDGWVVEAEDRNVGWIFGWKPQPNEVGDERDLRLKEDSENLYNMLEEVLKLYYQTNPRGGSLNVSSDWITKMMYAIAAGAFFNTDRMVGEYQSKIWSL